MYRREQLKLGTMNRKGQLELGAILMVFIAAIVGLQLFLASAQNIGETTNTVITVNDTITADNGTQNLNGRAIVAGTFTPVNETNGTAGDHGATVGSGNYTILNNQVVDGELTSRINVTADSTVEGYTWNVSYTYQPIGYIPESGGRAIAGLIILFFAISIAIIVLFPTLKNKILDGIK